MKKLVLLAVLFSFILPLQVEAQTQVNSIKFANRPDYHPTTVGNLWRKNDLLIWTYSGGETIIATGAGGGGTLAALSDVTLGTLYNGQVLSYDGISGQWENKWPWETSIDGRYVTTSTPQTISGAKDFTGGLSYAGVQVATSVASCQDVDLTTLANGHYIQWNSVLGKWHPVVLPPAVTDLASLTDVDVTTRVNGNLLMYDGSKWYNVTPSVLPADGRYVTTATVQTIPAAKVWQGVQTMSELRAAPGTGLSVKDSTGTTQMYIGSRPDFPNGTTYAMGQTKSTTYYVSTTGTASNSGLTPALAVDSFDSAMAKVSVGYVGQINIRYLAGNYEGFLWRGQGNSQAGKQRLNGMESVVVESDSGVRSDVVFNQPLDPTGDYLFETVWGSSPVIIGVLNSARIQLRNVTVKSSATYCTGVALQEGSHVEANNCTFKMEHDYAYVVTASRNSSITFSGDTTCTGYASPLNAVFSLYEGSTLMVDWSGSFTCTDYDIFGYADVNSHVELDSPTTFSSPVGHVNSYWVLNITNQSTLVNLAYPSGLTMNNVKFAVRMRGHGYYYLGYDMTLNLTTSGIGVEMADDSVLCGHGGNLIISGPSPAVKASYGLSVSRSSTAGGFGGWSLPLNISNCSVGVGISGNATLNTVVAPVFANCTTNINRADGAYGESNYSDFDRYIGGRMCYIGSTLTVASDAVTITRSQHTLNGQGAAADDLSTINGGVVAGQKLTLVRGNADITIKPWVGNIRGSENIVLRDVHDRVDLDYDGTNWLVSSKYLTARTPLSVTYYVATTGVATNDGLTLGSAVNTLEVAMQKVPSDWRGQVKLVCLTGTYAGIHLDGTRNAGSTSSTYPSEIVVESLTGVPANVTFNAVGASGLAGKIFSATGGTKLTLKNITIDTDPTNADAVYALNASDVTADGIVTKSDDSTTRLLHSYGQGAQIKVSTSFAHTSTGLGGALFSSRNGGRLELATGAAITATGQYQEVYASSPGSCVTIRCNLVLVATGMQANEGAIIHIADGTTSCSNKTFGAIRLNEGSGLITSGSAVLTLDGTDAATTWGIYAYDASYVLAAGGLITISDYEKGIWLDYNSNYTSPGPPAINSCVTGVYVGTGCSFISNTPSYSGNTRNYEIYGGRYLAEFSNQPLVGSNNEFFGAGAGLNPIAGSDGNVAIGKNAFDGVKTSAADENVAAGLDALGGVTSGNGNVGLGANAGKGITSGSNNTLTGRNCGQNITTAGGNCAYGAYSLGDNSIGCSAFGMYCLPINSGLYNSGFGNYSLSSNTSGSYNVAHGYCAGYTNTTESNRWYVGGWDGATQYPVTPWWETPAVADSSIDIRINRDPYKLPLMSTSFELGVRTIGHTNGTDALSIDASGNTTAIGTMTFNKVFQVSMGTTITTTTTVDLTYAKRLVDASGNPITIKLPNASAAIKGASVSFKASTDPGANTIYFTTVGGTQSIDGQTTTTTLIKYQWDSVELTNDGSNWYAW